MSRKFLSILSVLLISGSAATAFAGSSQDAQLERLKDKRDDVATASKLIGGAPRLRLTAERARLDAMIRDIESGRSVDPAQVDRAVEEPTFLQY